MQNELTCSVRMKFTHRAPEMGTINVVCTQLRHFITVCGHCDRHNFVIKRSSIVVLLGA